MTGSRITPGQRVELAVDNRRVHFFHPQAGLAIGRTS